ncbi:Nuclear cap-binding protein subunit 1 [Papilio machaon]|uniref:Nuclear cap-binding protein subunit 1 n=1 Tax=Papilio machaon TaxID=76193 RepID=A0A194RIN0_PAPMA|nr:Nuclear cap-binding protein subunit 1 [Papilio machaon]
MRDACNTADYRQHRPQTTTYHYLPPFTTTLIATSLPGTEAAHRLVVCVRNKCTPEEALNVLRELPNPLRDGDAAPHPHYNPLKIDVFVQTLLNLGSKSISHSFAAISKFHYVFKILAESEEAQICVLKNVWELWQRQPQMVCVLVDKMLKTQVVECSAVATWLFSKDMAPHFTHNYLWEILHLTIDKMNKHAVERMEERLELAHTDQKRLFLIVFQRFIMILSEHLVRCDTDARDPNTHWYRSTVARLRHVFLVHHEQVQKYSSTLETLLFTQDLDPHILDVFHQFVALTA